MISAENFKANQESLPTESTNNAEDRADFWSIQDDFISSSQRTSSSTLCVEGKTFTIPPKYIEVTRSTQTHLDVLPEKRIDDYWNVDSNRSLSDFGKVSRSLLY